MNLYDDEGQEEKVVVTSLQEKKQCGIPNTYIPVRLSSLGKLGVPAVVHVRDYSMEEILDIAMSNEDNNLETLIRCFNNMVYEDIDVADMNQRELMEVLFVLQHKYYSNTIVKHIFVNPDIEDEEELHSKENVIEEDIPISDLSVETLPDKFIEPFSISDENTKVHFRLNRIKDVLEAKQRFLSENAEGEKLYTPVLNRISFYSKKFKGEGEVIAKVRQDFTDDPTIIEKAIEYSKKKIKMVTKYTECGCILKINDKAIDSLDEAVKRYTEVTGRHWRKFNTLLEDYPFGIQPETTFYSTKLQKKITRRVALQFSDLLPAPNEETDKSVVVQFGN